MAKADDVRAGGAFIELATIDAALVKGLAAAKAKLRTFGKQAVAVGANFVKLGAAMAAPLAGGVKLAADFSDQMSFVATMLSGPALARLPQFSRDIRALSEEFGESTKTISGGLFDILSASVPAAKSMEVLRISMISAQAGFIDTKLAADAITTVLNSFRLSADKAADVSDFFFTVVKRGKTTMNELAPSIGQVASIANAAGLSLEEFGAALSTMTRNGVKTDIAVTALKAILTSFLKPQEDAAKAARKFGIELNTETLRTEGLTGVLKKLQGARAEDISSIFVNVRALTGLAPILQDVAGFTEDVALQNMRSGATQEAFSKRSQNLATQLRKLGATLKNFFLEIGLALTEDVKGGLKGVIDFIKAARVWVEQNKQLITGFARLAAHILIVGGSLLLLGKLIGLLAIVFGSKLILLIGSVVLLAEAFGLVDTGFTDVVNNTRIGSFKIETWLTSAWLEIFAGWEELKAGIIGGLDFILTRGVRFGVKMISSFVDLWVAAKEIWEVMKSDAAGLFERMVVFGKLGVQDIKSAFVGLGAKVNDIFLKMVQGIADDLQSLITTFNSIAPEILQINVNLSAGIKRSASGVRKFWTGMMEETRQEGVAIIDKFNQEVAQRAEGLKDKIGDLEKERAANTLATQSALETLDKDFGKRQEQRATELASSLAAIRGAEVELFEEDIKEQEAAASEGAERIREEMEKVNEALKNQNLDLESNKQAWQDWLGSSINVMDELREVSTATWDMFRQGFSTAVADVIVTGQNFAKALRDLMKQVAGSVIASLIDIAIQWVRQSLLTTAATQATGAVVLGQKAAETAAGQFAAMSSAPFPINLSAPAVAATMLAAHKGLVATAKATPLAEGGVITRPTLALIGEAGAEAVIPLDRMGPKTQTIIIELDGERIAEQTVEHMPDILRARAGLDI